MSAGRPTEYKPQYPQQVIEYLKTCGGSNQKLPKRVDLALIFDCNEETLTEWGKVNSEFSAALTRVDAMQKGQLMDDGFYGGKEVNPRMGQFLLSDNHGDYEPKNCRWISIQEQQKNRRNNGIVVGVNYEKSRNRWRATITRFGNKTFLGRYKNFDDAVKARRKAEYGI